MRPHRATLAAALAPTADQRHVVEISTKYVGSTCEGFFATGRA